MFCICSRICSISTFSSIEALVMRISADFEPMVLASRFISCIRKSSRLPTGLSVARACSVSVMCDSSLSISSVISALLANRVISCSRRPGSRLSLSSLRRPSRRSLNPVTISGSIALTDLYQPVLYHCGKPFAFTITMSHEVI